MKLIRWLLSNIILIAFVLALTYAYVYWDNLTGEDTPAGKAIAYLSVEYDEVREFLDGYDFGDGEADRVTETEPVTEARETASVPQVMPPPRSQPPQPMPQQAAPPAPVRQPPPVQATRPPASAPPVRQSPPVQAARPQPPAAPVRQPAPVQAPVPQVPPTAMVQQPRAIPPATPPQQPAARAPEQAVAEGKAEVNLRELWISAREEYHRGNIQQSVSNYREVIANSEDNYDAYGELGNVFLSRGKYQDAANAYFQAAAILVKKGQIGRARSLLPMLERLDRSKAEELNQLLSAPRG